MSSSTGGVASSLAIHRLRFRLCDVIRAVGDLGVAVAGVLEVEKPFQLETDDGGQRNHLSGGALRNPVSFRAFVLFRQRHRNSPPRRTSGGGGMMIPRGEVGATFFMTLWCRTSVDKD